MISQRFQKKNVLNGQFVAPVLAFIRHPIQAQVIGSDVYLMSI
jgi:hypothetical protein